MNRATILLLALLIVLGAIVLLVLPSDEERMTSETKTPVTFTVDSASVIRVSVERPSKKLVIENVGGRWTITSDGNLPADPARVTELIGGLSRFKTGSLVSTNPAKQGLFQVDSAGSLVTLTERSGAARSILIGKMGPSFSEVYFRLPGSSDVYLGSGVTTWSLDRDVKEWRDRTIFSSPAEGITAVTLASGGKTREFRKDSTGWKSGGDAVPTETINPILTALSSLRAEDFIDSAVQLSGTPSRIAVSGAVSATMDFYRLGSDTSRYAVQTSASPQKFIVGKYLASQLFKPVGEAKPTGVAAVRRDAGEGRPRASTGARAGSEEQAASEPPAKLPPASRTTLRTPPKTETVRPPVQETAKPAVEPPVEKKTEPATINPFKQRAPGERQQQSGTAVPPSSGGRTTQTQPPAQAPADRAPARTPDRAPVTTPVQPPAKVPAATPEKAPAGGGKQDALDDEGELSVHVVKKGETMTSIAKQYGVTVEQILKWNLLKSISVKPGQELYIFVRK